MKLHALIQYAASGVLYVIDGLTMMNGIHPPLGGMFQIYIPILKFQQIKWKVSYSHATAIKNPPNHSR